MDISAPTTPLMMDPFGKSGCQSPAAGTAFDFDFIGGNFFNSAEEDDLLSSLYNKNQHQSTNNDILVVEEDNTFTSLSNIINEKSLPDSPDSWVSNSSTSDNEIEDVELCEFTSANNVQKMTKKASTKQPPVMNGALPPTFMPNIQMNYPMQFQPGMMDPYMGAPNMMPMPMMSPQQLMYIQQQQQAFTTFNAMNQMNFQPTGFVSAPVPQKSTNATTAKKPNSPPLKSERSSPVKQPANNNKGNLKRRRDASTSPEVKDEESSPIEETNSANSSPTSSPSSSPTPTEGTKKDKDVKRQRRLIKNRESAQASRERKKVYVQGLEKRVDDLAQTNNVLSTKVLTLEEENNLLREKLLSLDRDGSLLRELEEPSFKKRRLGAQQPSKIPIPSLQGNSLNPFTNGFWNAFMGFAPPHTQTNQPTVWSAGAHSKKVVLFVVLFCVAVLVISSKKGNDGLPSTVNMHISEGQASVPFSEEVVRRVGARSLLKVSHEGVYDAIQPIVEQFLVSVQNYTISEQEGEEEEEEKKKKKGQCAMDTTSDEESSSANFDIKYDKEKKSLVLTFPVEELTNNGISIKQEEGTKNNFALQMDELTKKLMTEICSELKQ